MPELPEVETISKTLNNLVSRKTIIKTLIIRPQTIESDVDEFAKATQNKKILSVSRVGKHIIFHLSENYVIVSHLRMEGKYYLKNIDEKLTKHDLVAFYFDDNTYLIYNDTRRFGRMSLALEKNYLKVKPLCNVGPDPFMIDDVSYLYKMFKNKNIPLKQALLDQSIMSGLGNIYVDEVLFKTRLHPLTPAKLVSKDELKNILNVSKEVLTKAINAGGTTIKSYHPQQGVDGNFQVELEVYGKEGEICPLCGNYFDKIFVNGRGTTYCPHCQKNKNSPYVVAISGPIASGKSTIANYLKNIGYKCYDADKIVHDLYKDKSVQEKIKKFIPELIIVDGKIDREFLRKYLLANNAKKLRLEKEIFNMVNDEIKSIIFKANKNEKICLEIPLLFQSHLDAFIDDIIIVEIDKNEQLKRLQNRDKNAEEMLKINESYYKQERKDKATLLIKNNNDLPSLYKLLDKHLKH